MPDKMSQEKVRLLKAFGAEVIVTPTAVPPDHPDHYLQTARRIAEETPNAIFANRSTRFWRSRKSVATTFLRFGPLFALGIRLRIFVRRWSKSRRISW